jgi:catechol 2,3-dioxygenase-like lactoylglutathione lyase family enzyme
MRPIPSVVLFVNDVERMSRFYQSLAMMSVEAQDGDHVVLQVAGIQLVLHAIPEQYRVPTVAGQPVHRREDAYWKLCLPVTRISAARDTAAELGGLIDPVDKEWSARGFRACDGQDPEGNVVQVRESAA